MSLDTMLVPSIFGPSLMPHSLFQDVSDSGFQIPYMRVCVRARRTITVCMREIKIMCINNYYDLGDFKGAAHSLEPGLFEAFVIMMCLVYTTLK